MISAQTATCSDWTFVIGLRLNRKVISLKNKHKLVKLLLQFFVKTNGHQVQALDFILDCFHALFLFFGELLILLTANGLNFETKLGAQAKQTCSSLISSVLTMLSIIEPIGLSRPKSAILKKTNGTKNVVRIEMKD
jgi:hypothetical protein